LGRRVTAAGKLNSGTHTRLILGRTPDHDNAAALSGFEQFMIVGLEMRPADAGLDQWVRRRIDQISAETLVMIAASPSKRILEN
jgi:hypothetical protein